jgi:hypothetical protein
MVYFKPRLPYKSKLSNYGLGIYRVLSRKGNFTKLVDTDGSTRDANIRDLVLIREADRGVTELEGYQLLYSLLHGANKVPLEVGEPPSTERTCPILLTPRWPRRNQWRQGLRASLMCPSLSLSPRRIQRERKRLTPRSWP